MATTETYPDDLRYHPEHDWARVEDGEAVLGITWYAQDALGELVHFEPPEVGTVMARDSSYGEVESVKAEGPRRRLSAFVMVDKAIPRAGMAIEEGGEVTSGSLSPMLDVGIGLGYVEAASAAPDSELTIDVRGRSRKARVVKKPIYKRDE